MPITMRCPGCQTRFEFADDLDGKRIKCKSCGDIFRVAAPAPARTCRDDDDRPSGRYRRPADDDDRPRPRRRDDDSADDLPRRRDDDDFDRPRKKKSAVLFIVIPLCLVGLVGLSVATYFVVRGSGKGGRGGSVGDVVAAPTRSCPLEVAEKDAGSLVLPDGGSTFGLLRKTDPFKRSSWVFEPYDMTAKRRVGRVDLPDLEEPKAWSLSPDGKRLLITEARTTGWAGDQWLGVWTLDGKPLTQGKWFPYQKPERNPFDAPALFRAEFVANDKVLTLATNRSFFIYPLPTFDAAAGAVDSAEKDGLGKRSNPPNEQYYRVQWEAAFSADRTQMAVWTGDGYVIVNTATGAEAGRTTSCRQLARDFRWEAPDRIKAGPVAFSPDGKTLAGVIQSDWGSKRLLCLWDTRETAAPTVYPIAENQWNDATSIHWWGNTFVVTHGGRVDGMVIDLKTGLPVRQLMGPFNNKYGFSRDGKLWWVAGEDRAKPAAMHVVDGLNPDVLADGDPYEQIRELSEEFFLRRLWLEPTGILKQPTRDDPPIKQRLIRRP